MPWLPGNAYPGLISIPSWVAWAGVIPLGGAIGRLLGETLDLFAVPLPQGFGTEWSKLLSVMAGLFCVGAYLGILING